MARMVFTAPTAARGLANARLWLLQPGSGQNGQARWQALLQARRSLRHHPYLGSQPVNQKYRRVVISGYRMIYRIDPDTGDPATAGNIRIVALFGPGQP